MADLPERYLSELSQVYPELDLRNDMFLKALYFLEKSTRSLFLTGKAGTGKSTLIRLFREFSKKNIIVLAPTGIAAINAGGQTIHSFFRLPIRPMLPGDKEIKKFPRDHETRTLIQKADTVIIDEISMVRADVLDAVDYALRINSGNHQIAFGGKQMIFIGDPFQLPPVVTADDEDFMKFFYPSPYFFEAKSFNRRFIEMIELSMVYRQQDPQFLDFLNKIRLRKIGWNDLNLINRRYDGFHNPDPREYRITLCTTNKVAQTLNEHNLTKLDSELVSYEGIINGNFPTSALPTEQFLKLKAGSQVIFIKNDPAGRWVNGTIAKVFELNKSLIKVILEDGKSHEIEPFMWENISYKWDRVKNKIEKEVLGTFTQYPLKLAWAITIHKSQGLTFDQISIDLGRGAFSHGQLYVALSRCKKLDGIKLRQKIKLDDVKVDQRVADAYENGFFNENELRLD